MRLLFYSTCPMLLFVFFGTSAEFRFFNVIEADRFVNVTLSVRKFYSAASVIFIHPGDRYEDLEITHLIHASSLLLSRHYIMTAGINFKNLWRSVRYQQQIVQPIFVVILPNFEAYLEFAEVTKTYPMSFPVWFTMFFYIPDNSTPDYCHEPIGNPFNLKFDTQMLVLCRNDSILREWHSVKGETVKIFNLAEWENTDEGFILLTNLSLYDRRKDMEGHVLRVVTLKDLSSPAKFVENEMASMFWKILEELECSLNFTTEIVSEMHEYGLWNEKDQTWSGLMGEIVAGRADFAVADMSMTSFRIHYVDFTLPLIVSRNNLYIKEPGICGVKWLSYFQTFNLHIWATIITLIAVVPLLLSFMEICRESQNIVDLISENFICIWGIFCQQALIEFPKRLSLRIAYFTIFLTAVLITAHYSAALVSFLATCIRVLPFQTLDEFVNDGTYKLTVVRGSAGYDVETFQANKGNSVSMKLMKLMKDEEELPTNVFDGFMQVCKERRVAYMELTAIKKSVERKIPCKLLSINIERIENLGMVLSKGSSYTHVINYHLQKFIDNGMIMRLRSTEFSQPTKDKGPFPSVRLGNIIPILVILCGGIIISIALLIIEKIHYRSKRKKFQSKGFHPSRYPFIKKHNN